MSLTLPSDTDSDHEEVDALREVQERLAEVLAGLSFSRASDMAAVGVMDALEGLGRQVDAARVASAHDVARRAAIDVGSGSLIKKLGCRNTVDVITTVTRVSVREVKRRLALGNFTAVRAGVGAPLPVLYPAVGAALAAGTIGVDAAETIVAGLDKVARRADQGQLNTAEQHLVDVATGAPTGVPTVDANGDPCPMFALPADSLRGLVAVYQARLDPNGIAPLDRAREAKSSIGFGLLREGLYPLIGGMTPLDRGIMEKFWAAHFATTTPTFTPTNNTADTDDTAGETADSGDISAARDVVCVDTRPAGEKRADIVRALFVAGARHPDAPTIGGAAPTVMVHINAADLEAGRGVGWIDGLDAPLSLTTVTDLMKISDVEPIVYDKNGILVQVGSPQNRRKRLFDHLQRKAITARDGGCIIPGCTVPAYFCELNHVVPYSEGGDPVISNGCSICWWHHQGLDNLGGWRVRMTNGLPQVKAPHWLDPTDTWRQPQKHRASTPSSRG